MAIIILCFLISLMTCNGAVVTITSDNWNQLLTGEWMVEFYAPWCPYCQTFASVWEEYGSWAEDTDVNIGKVDVTEEPILAGQFIISQLPTILHIKDGEVREFTSNDRSLEGLQNYVENGNWIKSDPIPWYSSPTSLHMRIVGYFFVFSRHAQVIEDYLRKEYNLPTWGIFVVIAGVTVLAGLLMGGLCILVGEIISRSRSKKTSPPKLPRETRKLKPVSTDQLPKKKEEEEVRGEEGREGLRQRSVDDKKLEED